MLWQYHSVHLRSDCRYIYYYLIGGTIMKTWKLIYAMAIPLCTS
nr:MAG TPA: hypothetical protein [Caudoviricetes sp.]